MDFRKGKNFIEMKKNLEFHSEEYKASYQKYGEQAQWQNGYADGIKTALYAIIASLVEDLKK